jgi:flagellar biosynthesis protein FliQ
MIIFGHLNIIAPQWLVALVVGLLLIGILAAWKR